MSESGSPKTRPAQVTFAAWLIMVGSVFVVLMVWDRIAGLHTMESRKALQGFLDDPGVKGLGLDLGGLMTLVRTLSMVAAGCATAMAILGYQTLQRSRSARIGLSVLAFPLFVTGLATGGFLSSAVAAAVGTLWLRPARAWFGDGAEVEQGVGRGGSGGRQTETPQPWSEPPAEIPDAPQAPAGPSYPQPSRTPFGQPPSPYAQSTTQPYGQPYGQPAVVDRAQGQGSQRPAAALVACLVTWLFCALTALVVIGSIFLIASDSSTVLDKMHEQNPDLARQGVSDHLILTVCYVVCALFLVWVIAAAVVAVLLVRRVRWAWWALVVSTVAVIVLSMLAVIGSFVMLVPLAGAAATMSMLLRPEVRRWLA